MIKLGFKHPWVEFGTYLTLGFAVCFALYLYSIVLEHGIDYPFLVVNLFLALIPLLLSWRLSVVLKTKLWSAWEPLIITFLWLLFLPNSFYMISDYIHLQALPNNTILYNAILFSAFIYLALFIGIASLYQVHTELKKRISSISAAAVITIVIIGCSFAIYLGRDLRWDSWDIVLNPGGLLFDISNLLLKPSTYPDMGRTISGFFVLIGFSYTLAFKTGRLLWKRGAADLAKRLKNDIRTQ
jgi:uncharacterized membrane protein